MGEENQKIFTKVNNALGKTTGNSVPPAKNLEALMQKIADYLRDNLKLAENITVEKQGQNYIMKNRGPCICHGKLVKERYEIKPACAMSLFPAGALSENLKIKNDRLKESRKQRPIGNCAWFYEIAN